MQIASIRLNWDLNGSSASSDLIPREWPQAVLEKSVGT